MMDDQLSAIARAPGTTMLYHRRLYGGGTAHLHRLEAAASSVCM